MTHAIITHTSGLHDQMKGHQKKYKIQRLFVFLCALLVAYFVLIACDVCTSCFIFASDAVDHNK